MCVPGPYYHEKDIVINELIPELDKVQLKAILKDYFGNMPIYIDQTSATLRGIWVYTKARQYIFTPLSAMVYMAQPLQRCTSAQRAQLLW